MRQEHYAVIDIGANTVKCSIFTYSNAKEKFKIISRATHKVGLGVRRKGNTLNEDAIDDLCKVCKEYVDLASENNCGKNIKAVATASLRGIDNFEEVDSKVYDYAGIHISLLSGTEEAVTSFEGFLSENKHAQDGVMIDMGGGSTEVIKFVNRNFAKSHSFDFGCLKLYNKFVSGDFPTISEVDHIYSHVALLAAEYGYMQGQKHIYLVGGTAKASGELIHAMLGKSKCKFSKKSFDTLYKRLKNLNEQDKQLISTILPDRKELIVPGIVGLKALSDHIGNSEFAITIGGIREGVVLQMKYGGQK